MSVRTALAVLAALGLAREADAAAPPRDSPALKAFAADLDECARAHAALDPRPDVRDNVARCLPTLVSYKALEKPGRGLTGVMLADSSILPLREAEVRRRPGPYGRTLAVFALLEERLGAGALRPDPDLLTQAYEATTARVQSWKFARAQARKRRDGAAAWRDLAGPGARTGEVESFLREFLPSRLEVLWRRAGGSVDPGLAWITGEMASAAASGDAARAPASVERAVREAPEAWALLAERLDPFAPSDLIPLSVQAQAVLAEAAVAAAAMAVESARAGASGPYGLEELRRAAAVSSAAAPPPAPRETFFEDVDAAAAGFGFPAAESPFEDSGVDQMPGGLAVLDYDADGRPDLLVCAPGQARLMRGLGRLRFEDATAAAGLTGALCRNGASSADYDNDGRPDLLLLHGEGDRDLLFRNEGGRFTDVTRAVGLSSAAAQSTSAVWLDDDLDGRLDLYLVQYGDLMFARMPAPDGTPDGLGNRLYRGGPAGFTDVTTKAGVGDTAWGLGAAAFDYDADGDADLFVVNDFGRSALYRNSGDGTFEDVSKAAKVDFAGNGMGASVADYDGDGRLDLFVTYIGDERPAMTLRFPAAAPAAHTRPDGETFPGVQRNRLLRNGGDGTFIDASASAVESTATGWGWNGLFLDAGNRGRLDLFLVNGWWAYRPYYDRETKVFWRYEAERGFVDRSAESGLGFPGNSRVSAYADFDGDGCLDLIVTGFHPWRLFRGRCPAANRWLEVKLEGIRSNRDGIGARVEASVGGVTRVEEVGPQGGGFQNSLERVARFGLGTADEASVTVIWPGGRRQEAGRLRAGRRTIVREDAP